MAPEETAWMEDTEVSELRRTTLCCMEQTDTPPWRTPGSARMGEAESEPRRTTPCFLETNDIPTEQMEDTEVSELRRTIYKQPYHSFLNHTIMAKKEFPIMLSQELSLSLSSAARRLVTEYKAIVFPVLYKLGMLDDEHIARYLKSKTFEDIYKDALFEKKATIEKFHLEYLYGEEKDIWKDFMYFKSPVKSPKEEGFVYRNMPIPDYSHRDIVIKSLSIKDREISIDENILEEGAVVKPTAAQMKLWDMLSDFCQEYNKRGFYNVFDIRSLFLFNQKGIYPNARGVLCRWFLSEKKDSKN